jgi:hypothetical protein
MMGKIVSHYKILKKLGEGGIFPTNRDKLFCEAIQETSR